MIRAIIVVDIAIIVLILALIVGIVWYCTNESQLGQYDLNRDGLVNSSDMNLAYKISRGTVATDEMVSRADVNRDGLVDDKDVCLIFDAVLGGD